MVNLAQLVQSTTGGGPGQARPDPAGNEGFFRENGKLISSFVREFPDPAARDLQQPHCVTLLYACISPPLLFPDSQDCVLDFLRKDLTGKTHTHTQREL